MLAKPFMDRKKLNEARRQIEQAKKQTKPLSDVDEVMNLPDSPAKVTKEPSSKIKAVIDISTEQMLEDIKRKQALIELEN